VADSREALKEEVRGRINIVDVISEYVALKRAGKSHKGLCPFHSEKTPSFTVSEDFQSWHCFGCGEHGDVFSFLMKIENLTFVEAMERLAKRAGVELQRFEGGEFSRKDQLAKINALAAAYFCEMLKRVSVAGDYLRDRGLADETIQQFRLGYAAPAWDGLSRHLTERRINLSDAAQAGLVIKNDRGGYYDRFRHRIIFPILDIQARIIGFGGRALGDEQPKYLNSPETPLFSKTRSLYALNFARKAISEIGHAIVVEGYTDAIAAHQAGFVNCVATLGTALTLDHIGVISRYASKVVLAYDSDSAGMAAALKGAAMFEEAESDVRIARLPSGDDPDSMLHSGRVSEFGSAIQNALPITDYKLRMLIEGADLSSAAGKAAMLKQAVRVLADVHTAVEREKYINFLAKYHPNFESGTTGAEGHIRRDVDAAVRQKSGATGRRAATGGAAPRLGSAVEKAERAVLRVLIRGEDGAGMIVQSLSAEDFTGELSRAASSAAFEMFQRKQGIYLPDLLEALDEKTGGFVSEIAMLETAAPVNETVLQDYISLIKNQRLRKARTSSVFAPYMTEGAIDPETLRREGSAKEYEEFLRKSGRKPGEQA